MKEVDKKSTVIAHFYINRVTLYFYDILRIKKGRPVSKIQIGPDSERYFAVLKVRTEDLIPAPSPSPAPRLPTLL